MITMQNDNRLAVIFEKFRDRIAYVADLADRYKPSHITPDMLEVWGGQLLLDGLEGLFDFESDWRNAQLLEYMVAYWRRQAEEREDRGFIPLTIWSFLSEYNAAEYSDIVPYSKLTLAEAKLFPEVVDLVTPVINVAADRRSQLDNSPAQLFKWVTAGDARVCGTCKAHDGQIIGRTELIRESDKWEHSCALGDIHSAEIPPVHPRCRCKLVPITSY